MKRWKKIQAESCLPIKIPQLLMILVHPTRVEYITDLLAVASAVTEGARIGGLESRLKEDEWPLLSFETDSSRTSRIRSRFILPGCLSLVRSVRLRNVTSHER
ncbi:hypothetical protein MTO96_021639 [Rhipicephalus appendiculatus]